MKKGKILVLLLISFLSVNVYAKNLTNEDSLTYNRTKSEIIDKYVNSKPNQNVTLYNETPSLENYKAGSLSADMQNETLKKLNYLRWQYGLDEVDIKEEYNYLNQKCAMILAKLGFITHYPKDYASRLTDVPIDFLEDAAKGCAGGYGYSGDVGYSSNGLMFDAPLSYVSDRYNLYPGVGHRLSMFDPSAYAFSMGYFDHYDAISVYANNEIPNYEYYTWPNAGYAPIENLDPYEPWSVLLNNKYSFTSNTIASIYYDNYIYTPEVNYESFGNAISFLLPVNLLDKITNSNEKYVDGTSLMVKVSGIKEGNTDVELSYTVNLFNAELIDYNDLNFWYKAEGSSGYAWSKICYSECYYKFDKGSKYDLKFDVDVSNATNVGNFIVSLEDSSMGTINENSLTLKKNGRTNIIVVDDKTKKEFKFPIEVSNIVELKDYDINIKALDLTYNGEYQKLLSVDTDVTIYYSLDDHTKDNPMLSYITNIPEGMNAGTYTVYYYIPGNDEYNELKGNIDVTIKKANRETLVVTNYTDLYDGMEHTISVNKDNVLYSLDGINYQSDKILFKEGNHTIYVKYIDDNNYNEYPPQVGRVIISRDSNLGDLNFDTNIDIIDVKLLLLETYKEHSENDYKIMDINEDNVIDIVDVKLLLLKTFE